jgi:hypothetical protein
MTETNAGEDVEALCYSYISGGNVNSTAPLAVY